MCRICTECIQDKILKSLVELEGEDNEDCSICGNSHKCMDTMNNRFRQLFKALIRYYYNEWDYNTHWGGGSIESLFYKENPILKFDPSIDLCEFEGVLLSIYEGNVYEDYDKGVTLFAGYDEHGQPAGILRSLQSEISSELVDIERRLEDENYFNLEKGLKKLLKPYIGVIDSDLPEKFPIYRARIGYKDIKREAPYGFELEYSYIPYTNTDIGAPPPRISRAGRINREGVSFFYGATDFYTSMSEVRPHPGDKISIGKFELREHVKIADFTEKMIFLFFENDKLLDNNFLFINSINTYLNKTVPPSYRLYYSITQLIADCLRQLGYQGVKFKSTVGTGENITLFYPELAEYTKNECQVIEVQTVDYAFKNLKLATT